MRGGRIRTSFRSFRIFPLMMFSSDDNLKQARKNNIGRFQLLCLIFVMISTPVRFAVAVTYLEELSLEDLMKINIVGASKYEQNQDEVAAAVSVITRADIKTYGWRTLNEALASLPGIYTTYDYQYDYFSTRGLSLPGDFNTRVLVTINGNRINEGTYDGGAIGRDFPLDIDLIERIEFIPGPGSAVYGQNAMLGVVNVITRDGSDINGAELSASYQTLQSMPQGRVTLGKEFDNGVNALISLSGLRARGVNRFFDYGDSGISGVARGMDGENIEQLFARITRGPVAFDFIYGNRRKEDPTAAYLTDPLAGGASVRDRHVRTQIQYQDNFIDDSLNILGRLFLGQFRFDQYGIFGGEETLSTGPSDWHGAELRLLSSALRDHKLMVGAEYHNNTRIKQTFQNLENPDENVAIKSSVLRAGVYFQDEWHVTDTLSATVGLRYDYNKWIGSRLSPRGAVIWQVTPKATIKALYGRAHRSPNSFERDFEDGVSQVANSELRSESIDTIELVADYRPLQDMNLRTSVYKLDISNIITLGVDPVSGLTQYQQTSEKIITRGIEFSLDKSWAWGARLRGSFSFQNSEQHGSQIVNSPHYLGKLNFSLPLPLMTGLRAGYELQYASKRKTLDGTHTDGYFLSNLNLMSDVRWVKGLRASLSFYNLFNEQYQHPVADIHWQNSLGQLGRAVRFKLDYHF